MYKLKHIFQEQKWDGENPRATSNTPKISAPKINMAKVVSLTNVNSQKRLSLELKLAEINNELEDLEKKEIELCSQRDSIERQLYTSREQAEISISREAKKLTW